MCKMCVLTFENFYFSTVYHGFCEILAPSEYLGTSVPWYLGTLVPWYLGTWYQVPGTWYQAPGTRTMITAQSAVIATSRPLFTAQRAVIAPDKALITAQCAVIASFTAG